MSIQGSAALFWLFVVCQWKVDSQMGGQNLGVCHTIGVCRTICHTYWTTIRGYYIVKVTLHVDVTGHSTWRRTAHLVQETKAEKETKQEETVELW